MAGDQFGETRCIVKRVTLHPLSNTGSAITATAKSSFAHIARTIG
jgi:hypothetical protein